MAQVCFGECSTNLKLLLLGRTNSAPKIVRILFDFLVFLFLRDLHELPTKPNALPLSANHIIACLPLVCASVSSRVRLSAPGVGDWAAHLSVLLSAGNSTGNTTFLCPFYRGGHMCDSMLRNGPDYFCSVSSWKAKDEGEEGEKQKHEECRKSTHFSLSAPKDPIHLSVSLPFISPSAPTTTDSFM